MLKLKRGSLKLIPHFTLRDAERASLLAHATLQFISHEVEKIKSNSGIGPLRQIEAVISSLWRRHGG